MAYPVNFQDLRTKPHGSITQIDRLRLLTFGFIDPPLFVPSGGVPGNGSVVILGPTGAPGHLRLLLEVAANYTFRLDLQITPDNGITWVTGKSFLSAAGLDPIFAQSAEIDQTAPRLYRVVLVNLTASALTYQADKRAYLYTQH